MDAIKQLQLAEEQAAKKLHAALPAETPGGIRPMEAVWALIALVLFSAYLESSDVSQYVIAEKKVQPCEQYAKALAHVLNGGGLVVEGATEVSCRAKTIRSAS